MPSHPALRLVSRITPALLPGRVHHQLALAAAARGDVDGAERDFHRAVTAYRRELAVEALARLRVHEQMMRARASAGGEGEAEPLLEIVRALNRLDRLETMTPPHDLVDARTALALWLGERADHLEYTSQAA